MEATQGQPKKGLRYQLYRIVENEAQSTIASQIFDSTIMILIILSVLSIVLESFEYMRVHYQHHFDLFEHLTLAIFTGEYLLRVYTASYKYEDQPSHSAAAWHFVRSGTGIIDFLAIAPLFIPYFVDMDLRFIRILKMTRLLRVLKLSSLTRSIVLVGDVFVEKRFELGITMFATLITILVFSTVMYHIEHEAQPDKFPNIVATFWWSVITLTTVGYGDVYPVTGWGQLMGGIIALLGIGLVALPTGIISSAFITKIENQETPNGEDPDAPDAEQEAVHRPEKAEQHRTQVHYLPKEFTEEELKQNPHLVCLSQLKDNFEFCPYCGKRVSEIRNGL
jgi:voltage-gated potassium channel